MKTSTVILTAVCALFCSFVYSQQPIPPQKPVLVATDIGEVAGQHDKIQVAVLSTVTPKQIATIIQIKDKSMFGGKFEIDPKDVPELAKVIQTASDKLLAGQTYSGKAGKTSVAVFESEGQKAVQIDFESEGITFSDSKLVMDADNAASLAKVLGRAKQIADWLSSKLPALQPTQ
jgi:aspartokinase